MNRFHSWKKLFTRATAQLDANSLVFSFGCSMLVPVDRQAPCTNTVFYWGVPVANTDITASNDANWCCNYCAGVVSTQRWLEIQSFRWGPSLIYMKNNLDSFQQDSHISTQTSSRRKNKLSCVRPKHHSNKLNHKIRVYQIKRLLASSHTTQGHVVFIRPKHSSMTSWSIYQNCCFVHNVSTHTLMRMSCTGVTLVC